MPLRMPFDSRGFLRHLADFAFGWRCPHVESTHSRIDPIVERSRCLDGARRALDSVDYHSAARFIHTFFQIDAPFSESSDQREQLLECKRQLESIPRDRLAGAVDKWDHPTILRFVREFPPLGLQKEGLQIYVSYLRNFIALRSRLEFELLTEISGQGSHNNSTLGQGGACFVTCLTSLFKDIVLAVEENDEVLRSLCGEDGIVYTIRELQEECDSRGTQILKKYLEYRKLSRLASEINSYSNNLLSVGSGPDPKDVKMYLEEILSLTQLGKYYTEFMVSKIKGLDSVDPTLSPQATEAFRSGSFNIVVHDLNVFYVIVEKFFMVVNVRKAITEDKHVPNRLTTSMVDDVFCVLKSCCERAISTRSINSVFALLSGAINLLKNEYQNALEQKIKGHFSTVYSGGVGVQNTGPAIANVLNNVDISAECVLKLYYEIKEQCAEVFPAPADWEKVQSCLFELTDIYCTYRKIMYSRLHQLLMSIIHRIRPILDAIRTVTYELSDEEDEVNDRWVQELLCAIESNVAWLEPIMTPKNYDSIMHELIGFVVSSLYVTLKEKSFSRLGCLQLDCEVRALVNHFLEMSRGPVKYEFEKLSRMATNARRVSEILTVTIQGIRLSELNPNAALRL